MSNPSMAITVWLCTADGRAVECATAGIRAGHQLVAAPDDARLAIGDTYELIWHEAYAHEDLYRQRVMVVAASGESGIYELAPQSLTLRADRRENVRVDVVTDIFVSAADGSAAVGGRTLDIGEGGVKFEAPAKLAAGLGIGTPVFASFELRGASYDVRGHVARVANAGEGLAELVVGFDVEAAGDIRRAILVESVFAA